MSTVFLEIEICNAIKNGRLAPEASPRTADRLGLIRRKVCAALVELTHADAKVESTQRQCSVSFPSCSATGTGRHGAGVHADGLGKRWVAYARPVSRRAACQELRQISGAGARATHDFGALMHRYEPASSWDARRAAFGSRAPVQVAGEFGCGVPPSERLKSRRAFWRRYAPHPASPMAATPRALSSHAGQPSAAAHLCR